MADILRFEFLGEPDDEAEASYLVADSGRTCVLKSGGEAGAAAARILAGLSTVRVGETAFRVRRVDEDTAR